MPKTPHPDDRSGHLSLPAEDGGREETLRAGLEKLGLGGTDELVEQLLQYALEIELWNPRVNLVRASGHELIVKHVLDSLAPARYIADALSAVAHPRVADLGSGAGFPGIPLAAAFPSWKLVLVERSGRRVGFLRNALALLRLKNVSIAQADAFAYAEPNLFNLIVMRAFLPLSEQLLDVVAALLTPDGTACLYKGRKEEVAGELRLAEAHPSFAAAKATLVAVPFLQEQRHILSLRRA